MLTKLLKITFVFGVLISGLAAFLLPQQTSAAVGTNFRAGRIIDDAVFADQDSMSVSGIQNFLNSKMPDCDTNGEEISEYGGGTRAQYGTSRGYPPPYVCLKNFSQSGQTAAQIIWAAAQDYNINPKALIVLLQKEQGLVTDEWPWPTQYRSATGYGCPDGAACDAEYYGFKNQVRNAARMFRKIMDQDPNWYTPYTTGTNTIKWHPNASCGTSQVLIENWGTAALYNYTPYRPNQAALNNLYGSGNGCSSYGNRNFWRDFTDWFGSTYTNIRLIKVSGGTDVYLVEGATKRKFANPAALSAWGLDNFFVETVNQDTFDTFTTLTPELGMYARNSNNGIKYLVDAGKAIRFTTASLIETWGLVHGDFASVNGNTLSLLEYAGNITSIIKAPSVNNSIYLMDSGTLRGFSLNAYIAWTGLNVPVTSLSGNYFCTSGDGETCVNRFSAGANLTHTRVLKSGSSQEYFINNGKRYPLSAEMEPLFPLTPQAVSLVAIDTFGSNGYILPTIKKVGSGTIYLMDGSARPLASFGLFRSWTPNSILSATYVNPTFFNFLTEGDVINSNFCTNGGVTYVIDGGTKRAFVNNETKDLWIGDNTPTTCGNPLANFFPTQSSATRVIKGSSSTIYVMEDGLKRPIQGLKNYQSNYQQYGLTRVSDYLLANIPTGSIVTN